MSKELGNTLIALSLYSWIFQRWDSKAAGQTWNEEMLVIFSFPMAEFQSPKWDYQGEMQLSFTSANLQQPPWQPRALGELWG